MPTARIYMGLETRERGEKMELKVFRDSLSAMGSLCETKAELPVEAEILIPDYLPQVFKIIKCFVYLVPLQKQITAGRLTVDGYLRCVVYYQAEEDQSLCQTEQKLPFTRAMDLPEGDYSGYSVQVGGQLEYLNCRAVNQRRVDLRGAYALSARVACRTDQEVITALADCGIEQRMEAVEGVKCLDSLDKIRAYAPVRALPGHRGPGDLAQRVDQLKEHHRLRLEEALDVVRAHPGDSAYQVASHMTWRIRANSWEDFPVAQKWFAVGECMSHLDRLIVEGRITRRVEGGRNRYQAV